MSAIKHTSQRVAVFIDTQNLYHTAKHVYNNSRVHFGRVLEEVVGGRSLVRAIAYVITTESRDEANFFEALEKMGIEIKTKDLQTFFDGSKKADWDVAIAVDAIRIAPRVDSVVIVSGDGDFVPLVQHLQNMGVQVEVASFGKSISSKLREAADIFTDLSLKTNHFLINSVSNFKDMGKKQSRSNRRLPQIVQHKALPQPVFRPAEPQAPEKVDVLQKDIVQINAAADTVSEKEVSNDVQEIINKKPKSKHKNLKNAQNKNVLQKEHTSEQNPASAKPKPDLIPLSDKSYTIARKMR